MIRTIAVLLLLVASWPATYARAEEDYQAESSRAMALAQQNKIIEALPLFEDLAARNPNDDKVLARLAFGLIAKAAVADATDTEEGARLRVRARGLLLKAQSLGNTESIVKTDLELIPADGKIVYKDTPIDHASRQAEAAYSKGDYSGAIPFYQQMLAIDPRRYEAALYIGDCYEQMKDYDKAQDWFERAITIDPNRETAYRYYGTTLARKGEKARARMKFIQAVVAEPQNPRARRALADWTKELTGVDLNNVLVSQPLPNASAQAAYDAVKAKWKNGAFASRFPGEKQYRLTLAEESEALAAAADASSDPALALLIKLRKDGMIEPFLLLGRSDPQIMQDYASYRAANRVKLENYLDAYVAPPIPAH